MLAPSIDMLELAVLAAFIDPKKSDRLAGLIEALLDVGACDSRVRGWTRREGELSLTPPPRSHRLLRVHQDTLYIQFLLTLY